MKKISKSLLFSIGTIAFTFLFLWSLYYANLYNCQLGVLELTAENYQVYANIRYFAIAFLIMTLLSLVAIIASIATFILSLRGEIK